MNNALVVPISDIQIMATAVAESRMFGVATPQQAMALMLIAQAEGLHPAIAARDYHIIEGRPSLKADAMLSRFQNSGGKVTWHQHDDTCVSATFTHPIGGEITIEWNMERAKQAGLGPGNTKSGQPNMWSKYPRQMLRARVISEGIRTLYPGVVSGFYTPEEVVDFEPRPVVVVNPPEESGPDDLITAITDLAGLMEIESPSELLAKLTNNKYVSMHEVRTMPKAHREKLAAKVASETSTIKG